MRHQLQEEGGFTLIDLVMAFTILSLISVAIALSAVAASRSAGIVIRKSIAAHLSTSKLDELAAISPLLLNDTYDSLEAGLTVSGHEFTRSVDVTVNTDGTRRVIVESYPTNPSLNESVAITRTFAPWGTR